MRNKSETTTAQADALLNALAKIRDVRCHYGTTGFPVDFDSRDPMRWVEDYADAAIMQYARAATLPVRTGDDQKEARGK